MENFSLYIMALRIEDLQRKGQITVTEVSFPIL